MGAPKAIVTGSCGLIGSEVAIFLARQGLEITGIDDNHRAIFFGPEGDTSWSLTASGARSPVIGTRNSISATGIGYWHSWTRCGRI